MSSRSQRTTSTSRGVPSSGTRGPRALRFAGIALAAALALSACGSDSDDEPSEGRTKETVRIALSTFGNEQLDPVEEAGNVFSNALLPMYDMVLEIAPDGTIAPGIAEEWSQSDDGLTWTFKIREGVQFHGGYGEVTANDVVFSIKRWMDPANQSVEGPTLVEKIASIEAPDPRTVIIKTNGVQIDLEYYLSPHQTGSGIVMSEKYLTEEGGADFASQSAAMNEKPIGSGPFQFVSRSRGQNVVYEAVEDHWRATPAMKRVEFLLVPEPSTQIAMLRSGEADIIEIGSDSVTEVEGAGHEVRSVSDALSVSLMFTGTYRQAAQDKPTAKIDVRRALSMAIDRKTILEQVLGGYGSLPDTPWDTLPSTADIDKDHYTDYAQEWQTFDPERAKEMLADAGYPNGFSGVDMFTFTRPGASFLPQLGEIIASQWAEIGVQSPIVSTDYGNYRPHQVGASDDDPYNAGNPSPYTTATRFQAVDLLNTFYRSSGALRMVIDPEVDRLMDEASGEPDRDRRTDLVSEAFDIVNAQWTMIPLFRSDVLYGVNGDEIGPWTDFPAWPFMGRVLETIQ